MTETTSEESNTNPPIADEPEVSIDQGGEDIARLKEESESYREQMLRALADFDNLRKRSEREKSDLRKFATEQLMKDLLPILDTFDKALAEEVGSKSEEQEGITLVFSQFWKILENHGLKRIESVGQAFDPDVHQAIQRLESEDVETETVKDEFAKGYLLHDRLLRAAMVSVEVPKS